MPINRAEAQAATMAFVRDYPGALKLAYKFREDAAELHGSRATEVPADRKDLQKKIKRIQLSMDNHHRRR